MEGETNSKQVLCISGCGFFGSPTTEDFCSICFKEAIRKKQQNEDSADSTASIQGQISIREAVDVAAIAIQPQTHSEEMNDSNKDENKKKNMLKTEEVAVAAIAIQPETLSEEQKDCDKVAKKKKNRCMMCRKKVGLTGFDCRCGGLFCGLHRYSDKHECSFNYREMGAEEIKRKNPIVVGEKIRKI